MNVDPLIHEPSRFKILAALFGRARADFHHLLEQAKLTKGNLSRHISRLEEAGMVEVFKRFEGRLPKTTYRITERGRQAFLAYLDELRNVVNRFPDANSSSQD